jgi:hypothetical protein
MHSISPFNVAKSIVILMESKFQFGKIKEIIDRKDTTVPKRYDAFVLESAISHVYNLSGTSYS